MSRLSEHHKTLTEGKGKCSVPMWVNGLPAGFCDRDAFGFRPECRGWRHPHPGDLIRDDGKYSGHISGLACIGHGGPKCPGIEIEPGVFSGCDQSAGDCPTCGK